MFTTNVGHRFTTRTHELAGYGSSSTRKYMDERIRFVARLLDGHSMAAMCREFGVSRKAGYKIFNRYKDVWVEGRGVTHVTGGRRSAIKCNPCLKVAPSKIGGGGGS